MTLLLRRTVLAGLGATGAVAMPGAAAAAVHAVPADFMGLSYETAELVEGSRLSPDNASLIALFRRLGRGVLRLGGNSSDRARAHPTAAAIAALAGFLRATGWSLIYGLDLGNSSASQAAEEAAMVAAVTGSALICFQIGNEPDLFSPALRPRGWSVTDYLGEWHRFADAVLARVPTARFAGPDIAAYGSWMMPFARNAVPRPVLLTRHFYTEGPGSSPSVTIARMLGSSGALSAAMQPAEEAARAANLPIRMSETNSVYGGGRPGVSDTLAAAAWGADLMFRLAAAGWSGVNFHTRPNRSYAPLGEQTPPYHTARALYYGMLLFARSNPLHVSRRPAPNSPALSTYAILDRDGQCRLALINMSAHDSIRVALPSAATLLRLSAASAASTSAVTLGAAEVANDGSWYPIVEPRPANFSLELPPCNAVLAALD